MFLESERVNVTHTFVNECIFCTTGYDDIWILKPASEVLRRTLLFDQLRMTKAMQQSFL